MTNFSLFALSELGYTKNVFTLFYYSLLIYPKLIPFWSVPDGQTEKILHPLFPEFFFFTVHAGPYLQAQLYGLAKLWGGWPIEQVATR